jgi:LuxR family maltose regulon positive regulatory protein
MGDTTEQEIPAGRRHIIERPRLTRLLDTTSARVIMLVGPAGYGKTTLARQWLANRPHAWYQATAASGDVAGLAVGLAESVAALTPDATQRLRQRLLATRDASQEIPALAQIQADVLSQWPEGAWLAIDDYQFIASSEPADAYLDTLLGCTPLQLLLTSRIRPAWATSRNRLYGHIYELGRGPLSMNDEEARMVLTRRGDSRMSGLLELAEGWPAVIGLAALTGGEQPDNALPETLYEFLADELYQAASAPLQSALQTLALCPPITPEVRDYLFGSPTGADLLAEATRIGFLTTTPHGLALHPLLRSFLLSKLREADSLNIHAAVRRIAEFLLQRSRWDDVFDLFKRYPLSEVLIPLVERANEEMLSSGRLGTLADWLGAARELHLDAPLLDIVTAELALRQGNLARAETLGLHVGRSSGIPANIKTRAFAIAGRAAYLANRHPDALTHYECALQLAHDRESRRRASWGKLICFHGYGRSEELERALSDFLQDQPQNADEVLQSLNARVMVAANIGGMTEALESALSVKRIRHDVRDPLTRTAYLNVLARTSAVAARYADALRWAEELIEDAERFRLLFVEPYAYIARAVAELGLRRFGATDSTIDHARQVSEEINDIHNLVEAHALQCKLAVATSDFDRALDATADTRWNTQITTEMLAEYEANRALAFVCKGRIGEALAGADKAAALTSLPEVLALVACVRAIATIREGTSALRWREASKALQPVFDQSLFDAFVVAYRGFPELLRAAVSSAERGAVLANVLREANDVQIAKAVGIDMPAPPSATTLSPRETEVLSLLSLGYTNQEIAAALHIAQPTAKVHVRRVLQKLGVRSRTEAALAALKEREP